MESSAACRPHYKCQGEPELKIPSPRGGPPASRTRFPWSAPRTAPAGRAHALLARGLPIIIIIIALAALVLSSVGHAQTLDPVLVSNTGQTAGSDLATATGRVSYAQSFTTGEHPDGYFLSSVDVGLKAGSGVTAEVELWRSHRVVRAPRIGFFFFPHLKLTTLSGVASIDDDASTLERFSANDVLLLPGTTYWIVVTRTGGADDGLSVATTSSEDAVDAGGMAGFSVGDNVWVPDVVLGRGPRCARMGRLQRLCRCEHEDRVERQRGDQTAGSVCYQPQRTVQDGAGRDQLVHIPVRHVVHHGLRPRHSRADLGVAERGGRSRRNAPRRDPRGRQRGAAGGECCDERHTDGAGRRFPRSRRARAGRVHREPYDISCWGYQVLGRSRRRLRNRQSERQHDCKRW